jgi:hypothetical protein
MALEDDWKAIAAEVGGGIDLKTVKKAAGESWPTWRRMFNYPIQSSVADSHVWRREYLGEYRDPSSSFVDKVAEGAVRMAAVREEAQRAGEVARAGLRGLGLIGRGLAAAFSHPTTLRAALLELHDDPLRG